MSSDTDVQIHYTFHSPPPSLSDETRVIDMPFDAVPIGNALGRTSSDAILSH